MNEILKIFLSLSLSGSLLILVLLLCRPLFKNKVSKSWQYYIWLVVIIRLLLISNNRQHDDSDRHR